KSIKFAESEDAPKSKEIQDRIEQRKKATFTEGFVLRDVEADNSSFSFYAEINVDNSRFWDVFFDLSKALPEVCACIFAYESHEPIYGDYIEKENILDVLSQYKKELTEDCFLEFGLIFNTDTELVEVYVPRAKYFQFWGNDKIEFLMIMSKNNLFEFEEMSFVDEFPKVVYALKYVDENARTTGEVINALEAAFLNQSEAN